MADSQGIGIEACVPQDINMDNELIIMGIHHNFVITTTNRLPEFRRKKIDSRNDLQHGDQVAWHRKWGFWHHAIFDKIDVQGN